MKTKVLLYCTKGKPYLYKEYDDNGGLSENGTYKEHVGYGVSNTKIEEPSFHLLNGKIVAECEVECEEIVYEGVCESPISIFKACRTKTLDCYDLNEKSCLNINNKELEHYLMPDLDENNDDKYFLNVVGYALHITNLRPLYEPLAIEKIYQPMDNNSCKNCREYKTCHYSKSICKPCIKVLLSAPQNMCRVWYKDELYVLISIRPEWVCKILNGEKTIEIRKKILRGM